MSELIRLGSLGAVFTDDSVAIKGLPLMRATMYIDESVDVGASPILTVYGAEEGVSIPAKEEEPVKKPATPKKTARASKTTE